MKFSIITPSFNQVQFLEQTIKSVVSQKVDLEYFIMDGGSTDGSVEIIKKYAKKYPFIYWESKKDKGQVDAINKGLAKATGDVIAYLNSDDYYLPGSLNKIQNHFERNTGTKWIVGNCQVSDIKLKWTFTIKHLMPIDKIPGLIYLFNWINQPSVFLSHDLVKNVGFFDDKYKYAFDYDYWIRCQSVGGLACRLRKELSFFRIHNQSKGNTAFMKQFDEDFAIIKRNTRNNLVLIIHKCISLLIKIIYRKLKQ